MQTRIKFCGLTRLEDAQHAVDLGVDALGFVFYEPSKRFISPLAAGQIIHQLPPFVSSVGLFVNATFEAIVAARDVAGFTLLQFHGDETARDCAEIAQALQLPFIKAVAIRESLDLVAINLAFRGASPFFRGLLLDTPSAAYGGSGVAFDWSLVQMHTKSLGPFILSGGLTPANINIAINTLQPYAVDVSSGIESSHGKKDVTAMQAFVDAVKFSASS